MRTPLQRRGWERRGRGWVGRSCKQVGHKSRDVKRTVLGIRNEVRAICAWAIEEGLRSLVERSREQCAGTSLDGVGSRARIWTFPALRPSNFCPPPLGMPHREWRAVAHGQPRRPIFWAGARRTWWNTIEAPSAGTRTFIGCSVLRDRRTLACGHLLRAGGNNALFFAINVWLW
jgi:hypothetical protein